MVSEKENSLPMRLGEFQLLVRARTTAVGELFVARSSSRKKSGGLCFVQTVWPGFESDRKLRLAVQAEKTRPQGEGLTNLFDAGVIDDTYYFAYEFGDVLSLEFLQRASKESGSTVSWTPVVQVGIELLEALEVLHASKPLSPHGDVRPENVFISRKGRVILGRAQPFWQISHEKVLGFDVFVPPEQRFGVGEAADTEAAGMAADLWGAAATLWFLLFRGRRRPEWALGARGPSRGASEVLAPDQLDDFFERSLSPSPQERFVTATQMRLVLETCREQVGKYTAEQSLRNWFLSLGESEIIAGRNLISGRIRTKNDARYGPVGEDDELLGPGDILANRYRLAAPIAQDELVKSFEAEDEVAGGEDKIVFIFRRLTDSNALRRLRRRVGEVAGANHPATAQIDWMGATDSGAVFLVLKPWNGRRLNWMDEPPACEQDAQRKRPEQRQTTKGRLGPLFAKAAGGAVAMGLGGMLALGLTVQAAPEGAPCQAREELLFKAETTGAADRGVLKQRVTVSPGGSPKDLAFTPVSREEPPSVSSSIEDSHLEPHGVSTGDVDPGQRAAEGRNTKKQARLAATGQATRLVNEGRRLFRASRLDEAKDRLQRASRLVAHRAEIPYLLGKIAFQEGNYPQAAKLIEKAVAMNPSRFSWRNYLGKVYLAMGDEARASKQWRSVLEEDPDNEEARRYAGVDVGKDAQRGPRR